MGNCRAVETATTVVQRPDGKLEGIYSTVTACEVIKSHLGHHVALLISSDVPHELTKGSRAKRSKKMKKIHGKFSVAQEEIHPLTPRSKSAFDKDIQRSVHEKQREMMNTIATNKLRAWQPSLQSISESTS